MREIHSIFSAVDSDQAIHLKGFRIEKTIRFLLHASMVALVVLSILLIVASQEFNVSLPGFLFVILGIWFGFLLVAELTPFVKPYLPSSLHHGLNIVRATVLDDFVKVACFLLLPFRQTWFDPKGERITDQIPTLLIHGYLNNSSVWIYHRYHYQKMGMGNIFTVDLGSPFRSIEEYALVVRKKVQLIQELTGSDQIRFVGHSMGGLVGAYYATHLAERDGIHVTDLVTLGTPLQGTFFGWLGVGACSKQMKKDSVFIQELNKSLAESKMRCFHQGSLADLVVFPGKDVSGDERHPVKIYEDLGHLSFLFSDRVIRNNLLYFRWVSDEKVSF